MLTVVKAESAERLTEIRQCLDFINPLIPVAPIPTPRHLNSLKGEMFVQLYGAIECTVTLTLKSSIDYINSLNLNVNDIRHSILGLVLNSEFDALISVASKKWDKRHNLTDKIKLNPICNINNTLIPTDGKNFGHSQLQSVWKTFSITDPIYHDLTFTGRLSEIIDNRNKIAHGVYAASNIGNRVTLMDLYNRQTEVSRFCSYFISVFEDYLNRSQFRA